MTCYIVFYREMGTKTCFYPPPGILGGLPKGKTSLFWSAKRGFLGICSSFFVGRDDFWSSLLSLRGRNGYLRSAPPRFVPVRNSVPSRNLRSPAAYNNSNKLFHHRGMRFLLEGRNHDKRRDAFTSILISMRQDTESLFLKQQG
jgi:hypothetical protein